MEFFFVGIVIGTGLLIYGTKKGWLAGKIDLFERPPKEEEEKSLMEMVNEDKEDVDPNKTFMDKFKDRAETDPEFKNNFTKFVEKRKEAMFKGLSPKDKQLLEGYLKDEIAKAKKERAEGNEYDAFRSYTCEIFILVALIVFIWWGVSQHVEIISPTAVGRVLLKFAVKFFGLDKNDKNDL